MSRIRRIALGVVIGATGMGLAAPLTSLRGDAATTTVYAPAITGVVSPSHGAPANAAPANNPALRGVRPTPRTAINARSSVAAPQVAESAPSVTTSVLHNFNGVSSRDSGITNFNQEFEPPDQGLCVGNGFVLEAVNSAYRVYTTSGASLVGPSNVNDLFDEGSTQFTSDPRCYYDPTTHTWFATILFLSGGEVPDGKSSHLDIAVNSSGNPESIWTQYQIDTTHPGGNGCPCFGDQPTLGIDQNNLYITTNEFSILGKPFNGAQIYALSKEDLVASEPLHFAHFGNLSIGGGVATSVQPAISTGTPNAEFFMNSLDPNHTFDNRLGVWAMTNRTAVEQGHSPMLSSTVISSEAYGVPPPAAQKGSTSTLDSGDDRMQQTQFINGTLWGELTTAVTIPNDSAERAGAAWFGVQASVSGNRVSVAGIRQGYVVKSGGYVIYPALEALSSGNAVMVFTLTGPKSYASAAYAALGAGQSAFGAIQVAAGGSGPYDPNATRWGDYSWAVIDPSAQSVWLATEYMPPLSSQTADRLRNWGTRVIDIGVA